MKFVKIVTILLLVYVGIVIAFESLLGYFQPAGETTLVITTTDGSGHSSNRVLSRIESDGQLYVAANHWPRAWYRQALANPSVQIEMGGEQAAYLAVPIDGDEHDRVDADQPLGPVIRILTGFPPRYFVRLDPVSDEASELRAPTPPAVPVAADNLTDV
ncbi:MAG: nitroreductase/quinone reductase family protein [Pseudomonadales bacterium]